MISKTLLTKLVVTSVIASSCIGYIVYQTRQPGSGNTAILQNISMDDYGSNDASSNDTDASLTGAYGGFETGRVGR